MVLLATTGLQGNLLFMASKGNVLFIILIAVALFASLSYVVSQSFRGGTNTISQEQARVAAGEVLRSMQAIKSGYDYLWNQQGCSIDEISFIKAGKEIGAEDFDASSPKGDESCDIFHPLGGGIAYPENLLQYQNEASAGTAANKFLFWFTGFNPGGTFRVDNVGTTSNDHIIFLQAVLPEICINVNKTLDYANANDDLIDAGNTLGDATGNVFQGQIAGCRARAAGGAYDIYYVLQDF